MTLMALICRDLKICIASIFMR